MLPVMRNPLLSSFAVLTLLCAAFSGRMPAEESPNQNLDQARARDLTMPEATERRLRPSASSTTPYPVTSLPQSMPSTRMGASVQQGHV